MNTTIALELLLTTVPKDIKCIAIIVAYVNETETQTHGEKSAFTNGKNLGLLAFYKVFYIYFKV